MGWLAFVVRKFHALMALKKRKETLCIMENKTADVLKGLVAGLASGFVASWTMNQFQAAWTRMAEGADKSHGAQSMQPAEGSKGDEQRKRTQRNRTTRPSKQPR